MTVVGVSVWFREGDGILVDSMGDRNLDDVEGDFDAILDSKHVTYIFGPWFRYVLGQNTVLCPNKKFSVWIGVQFPNYTHR